jgi:endonuclease V-like protein UPF0215 family
MLARRDIFKMSVQVGKKGIRALGISESFIKGVSKNSVLAGVIMRADRIIDGFTFTLVEVGGMDSTEKILKMVRTLNRKDINLLLLSGCVISWYNIVDLNVLSAELALPLICVTYETSNGLEKYFEELFPNDKEERIRIYHKNGERTLVKLKTKYNVYVRAIDMQIDDARLVLNKFIIQGAVPEPLRVARLLARSIVKKKVFNSR